MSTHRGEAILMSTHNIGLYEDLTKIIFKLSSSIIKYAPYFFYWLNTVILWEARWASGRASDSGARDPGFDPHSGRRVVSLSKIHLPPKKYW